MLKKLLKALGWTLAALVVVYIVAWIALTVMAGRKEKEADEAWRKTGFPTLAELRKQWPGRDDNAAALALEKNAAALGIRLSPSASAKDGPERNLPEPAAAKALAAATEFPGADGKKTTVADWLGRALGGKVATPIEVPAPLAAWLDANRAGLDGIAAALQNGQAPAWKYRLSYDSPLVSLAGCQMLNRLLVIRALQRSQAGDAAGAEANLEAAWKLGEAVGEPPILINVLIRAAMQRLQMAALRRLPAPDARWRARMETVSRSGAFLDSLSIDSRLAETLLDDLKSGKVSAADAGLAGGISSPVLRPLFVPYMRYATAEMSRLGALTCGAMKDPATAKNAGNYDDVIKQVSWLARPIAGIAVPNYISIRRKLDRVRFEGEFTGRVLALRAERTPAGAWPASLADGKSAVVEGGEWHWTPDAGGGTLSFTGKPDWEQEKSATLVVEPEWRP